MPSTSSEVGSMDLVQEFDNLCIDEDRDEGDVGLIISAEEAVATVPTKRL